MSLSSMPLGEIAELLSAELRGDPETEIRSLSTIHEAGPGAIAFISNRKYIPALGTTRASAVLVSPAVAAAHTGEGPALVVLDDPYMGFALLLTHWSYEPREVRGVDPRAIVEEGARLGAAVNVGAGAFVGAGAVLGDRVDLYPGAYVGAGAKIGDDTVLGPNCVVHHGCEVGARCAIYAGAVVGSDGFGFAPNLRTGLHQKIPQIGNVVIEDDVEVGANCTIDRAVLGETRIGQGTKLDNQVQVGHNAQLGRGCFIVAQVGISGTTVIGDGVTIAGQSGVAGHIKVGDGAVIGAQAGVHNDIPSGARVIGSPAIDGGLAKRAMAVFPKLPQLKRRVRELERRLDRLEPQGD
ncbi:MAG: UDP-3-O-(3-hydroxymyristoyl)glucosamine N-acyltransferase [Planctomycetes bacterium]|nr:UDP-3-O-(3-hydroxymyristoyl)glucosamine N-acyltransferase [Planctomycetota bacterium]